MYESGTFCNPGFYSFWFFSIGIGIEFLAFVDASVFHLPSFVDTSVGIIGVDPKFKINLTKEKENIRN